ncbi:MAG: hypothetical protein H6810_07745 [Phycisphaeraceae bacterium]|nr:MAG: hypothetical protein H6810_07745 [Phycisphaeraceae bacterium]
MRGISMTLTSLLAVSAGGLLAQGGVNLSGTYSGSINGDAFTATSTGWLEAADGSGYASIDFDHMPDGYAWQLPAGCWVCFICCNGRLELASAQNMFTVTGGNYSFERTITYSDSSQVTLSGSVAYDDISNTLVYDVVWGGSCTIPLADIVDVAWPAEERFSQLGPGSISSHGATGVTLAGGGTMGMTFDGTITYAGGGMLPFDEVAYLTATSTWVGPPDSVLTMGIAPGGSYIIPAPGAIMLVGVAGIGLGSRRRRTLV